MTIILYSGKPCRVSELLVSAEQADDDHIATMNDLCGMLVPLLKFDSHPKQLYVVRTVNSLIPRLSSAEAAMTHFHTLSKVSCIIHSSYCMFIIAFS